MLRCPLFDNDGRFVVVATPPLVEAFAEMVGVLFPYALALPSACGPVPPFVLEIALKNDWLSLPELSQLSEVSQVFAWILIFNRSHVPAFGLLDNEPPSFFRRALFLRDISPFNEVAVFFAIFRGLVYGASLAFDMGARDDGFDSGECDSICETTESLVVWCSGLASFSPINSVGCFLLEPLDVIVIPVGRVVDSKAPASRSLS